MSLFLEDARRGARGGSAYILNGKALGYALRGSSAARPLSPLEGAWSPEMAAVIPVPDPDAGPEVAPGSCQWALLAGPSGGIRRNGLPVNTGFAVLRDRDEVVVGGRRFLFSEESLVQVTRFEKGLRPLTCARCGESIQEGEEVVRCPHASCRVWVHQSAAYPCWTGFADEPFEVCPACEQPIAFENQFAGGRDR